MKEEIIPQLHGPDIIEGHLGGCSIGGDGGTYYPIMWKYLIDNYNVKTVLDLESQTNDLREKSNEDVTNRLNDPESPFFEPHFLTRGLFFKNNNFE